MSKAFDRRMDRIKECRRCGKVKPPPRDKSTILCLECESETRCVHDNWEGGLRDESFVCAAGVHWFDLVKPLEGCLLRDPCFWHGDEEAVTCPKFTPTPIEDCIAADKEREDAMQRMMVILPVVQKIKQEHQGESWQGKIPCPTGCGGELSLSHSAVNGHVWGRCSTQNCVAWME